MAGNCIAVGEVSKAAQVCQEGLQLFQQSDELRLLQGECLTRLCQFEAAEKTLSYPNGQAISFLNDATTSGLYTFRKNSSLGALYQCWDRLDQAQIHFKRALEFREDWVPAHIGLIELEIMEANLPKAEQDLAQAMDRFGLNSALMLMAANLAFISSRFKEADDIIAQLQGRLLGDDRFEYLLFQVDFFKGDCEALKHVPYLMTGETVETEAARIWVQEFKGEPFQENLSRIPQSVWYEEYLALDRTWQDIGSQTEPFFGF
jgi:tetratricopeptide (TPR) repeat protein